ncbi:Hypothetical_protein [Hexamita inflata]|uniref:Hypothetical_protein n=1 Tax=Hexamita inflata TaxID=28002 RepID=A0AA86R4L3_9EUKA|nr:Hypothetical protein HINF_LOCUS53587 [Hexamita inflata]
MSCLHKRSLHSCLVCSLIGLTNRQNQLLNYTNIQQFLNDLNPNIEEISEIVQYFKNINMLTLQSQLLLLRMCQHIYYKCNMQTAIQFEYSASSICQLSLCFINKQISQEYGQAGRYIQLLQEIQLNNYSYTGNTEYPPKQLKSQYVVQASVALEQLNVLISQEYKFTSNFSTELTQLITQINAYKTEVQKVFSLYFLDEINQNAQIQLKIAYLNYLATSKQQLHNELQLNQLFLLISEINPQNQLCVDYIIDILDDAFSKEDQMKESLYEILINTVNIFNEELNNIILIMLYKITGLFKYIQNLKIEYLDAHQVGIQTSKQIEQILDLQKYSEESQKYALVQLQLLLTNDNHVEVFMIVCNIINQCPNAQIETVLNQLFQWHMTEFQLKTVTNSIRNQHRVVSQTSQQILLSILLLYSNNDQQYIEATTNLILNRLNTDFCEVECIIGLIVLHKFDISSVQIYLQYYLLQCAYDEFLVNLLQYLQCVTQESLIYYEGGDHTHSTKIQLYLLNMALTNQSYSNVQQYCQNLSQRSDFVQELKTLTRILGFDFLDQIQSIPHDCYDVLFEILVLQVVQGAIQLQAEQLFRVKQINTALRDWVYPFLQSTDLQILLNKFEVQSLFPQEIIIILQNNFTQQEYIYLQRDLFQLSSFFMSEELRSSSVAYLNQNINQNVFLKTLSKVNFPLLNPFFAFPFQFEKKLSYFQELILEIVLNKIKQ